jgi:hypothetical protein
VPRFSPTSHQCDAGLDQVPHHRIDIAADIALLGELRGLDLEERQVRQLRQASRDLRLPTPVGPIRMMLLGTTSRRASPVSCIRRQRLRSAMATAFFASACPMM